MGNTPSIIRSRRDFSFGSLVFCSVSRNAWYSVRLVARHSHLNSIVVVSAEAFSFSAVSSSSSSSSNLAETLLRFAALAAALPFFEFALGLAGAGGGIGGSVRRYRRLSSRT